MKITEAVDKNMAVNASMAMLLSARPDAAELIKQAFRVGFADGALWQSVHMLNAYSNDAVKRDQLARHEGRPEHDMDAMSGTALKAG